MAHSAQPEFTGIQKYPGIVAIIFTAVIAVTFIGLLYGQATGDHGGGHGGDHAAEEAH